MCQAMRDVNEDTAVRGPGISTGMARTAAAPSTAAGAGEAAPPIGKLRLIAIDGRHGAPSGQDAQRDR